MANTDDFFKQPAVSSCGVKKSIPVPHFCTAAFLWFDPRCRPCLPVTKHLCSVDGHVKYEQEESRFLKLEDHR